MTVEVFTTDRCGACYATKRWLDNFGVAYVERSASDYADHLRLNLGHTKAPVVTISADSVDPTKPIGERVLAHWSGYRPDRLAEMLGDFPERKQNR